MTFDNEKEGRVALDDLREAVRLFKRKASESRKEAAGVAGAEDEDMDDIEEMDEEALVKNSSSNNPATTLNRDTEERNRLDPHSSAIEQLDMVKGVPIRRHDNLAEAAAAVNGLPTFISKACLGIVDGAYGFRWRMVAKEEAIEENEPPTKIAKTVKHESDNLPQAVKSESDNPPLLPEEGVADFSENQGGF